MTYLESYEKLETIEDIRKEVVSDIATAQILNTDRIPIIIKSANEVLMKKFGTKFQE